MQFFRIEVNFLGLSKKAVKDVLKVSKRNRYICARGTWELRRKGSALGPSNTKMISYQLVTPLINIYEIGVLKDVLTSLYEEAGSIILDNEPLKIHFLGKFRNGLARRIVYDLVSENKFMHTLIMYRRHYSALKFASEIVTNDEEVFIPYTIYFSAVKNGAVAIMVDELISEILLRGAQPE